MLSVKLLQDIKWTRSRIIVKNVEYTGRSQIMTRAKRIRTFLVDLHMKVTGWRGGGGGCTQLAVEMLVGKRLKKKGLKYKLIHDIT